MIITLLISLILANCVKDYSKLSVIYKQKLDNDLKKLIDEKNRLSLLQYFFNASNTDLLTTYDEQNRNIAMLILSSNFDNKDKEILFLYLVLRLTSPNPDKIGFDFNNIITQYNNLKDNLLYNNINNNNINSNLNSILEKLFKHKDMDGRSLIFYALELGSETIINFLIEIGADIEVIDNKSFTPLAFCISERTMIISYLMDNNDRFKFNINYTNTKRTPSPLALAASLGNELVVRMLLKKGADPDSSDENNNKAIILAANYGHENIVRILLAAGAKHLTGKEIKEKKSKKISQKVVGTVVQTAVDAGLKIGAGSPISPSIGKLIGGGTKHTVPHTECYEIINEIFKEGEWIFEYKDNSFDKEKILKLILKLIDYTEEWKGNIEIIKKYNEKKRKAFTSKYKKSKIIKRIRGLIKEIEIYQKNDILNAAVTFIPLINRCSTLISKISTLKTKLNILNKDISNIPRMNPQLFERLCLLLKKRGKREYEYEKIELEFNELKCKIK